MHRCGNLSLSGKPAAACSLPFWQVCQLLLTLPAAVGLLKKHRPTAKTTPKRGRWSKIPQTYRDNSRQTYTLSRSSAAAA